MLSRETVEMAYRLILGREPESDAAIESHRGHADLAGLRRTLLTSPEFRAQQARAEGGEDSTERQIAEAARIIPPASAIETAAHGAPEARLWARVIGAWEALGREAPHWSVLTAERYRPERIAETGAEFARSGEAEGRLADAALARLPGLDPARAHCLELGCGVGRATRALAKRFAQVTGVDVSPGHLAVAEADFAAEGVENARFRRVAGPADYAALPAHDFLFSRIVLQHNPPPVQCAMLSRLFARLASGGAALFQLVTHIHGYAYALEADLARPDGGMEMHALPQERVFALMAEAGLVPVEVQEDSAAGDRAIHRSHVFLARKPA